jgi:hypothetical protein
VCIIPLWERKVKALPPERPCTKEQYVNEIVQRLSQIIIPTVENRAAREQHSMARGSF